jgi:hypothetical protein
MPTSHPNDQALNAAIPGGVALGGLTGLIIADQIWTTPQAFREHGWEPGLIIIVCIAAFGAAIYAARRYVRRR